MKRIHLFITGRVQGVFFRAFVQQNAIKLGLTGWVRNIKNKVEVVAEGDDKQIKDLIIACKSGPTAAKIENVGVIEEEYCKEFSEFEIRYEFA